MAGESDFRADDVLCAYNETNNMRDANYHVAKVLTPASAATKNQAEVEGLALDAFRARSEWLGYAWLSTLIEARYVETGPAWMKAATVTETIDNYMHSGVPFVYLRSSLVAPPTEG